MCILLNMCTDMHLQSFMVTGKLKILQQAEIMLLTENITSVNVI
jgi:hypothetical protein